MTIFTPNTVIKSADVNANFAEDITDTRMDYPRWYHEIGRTTLSASNDNITASSLPARKYLRLLIFVTSTGGTINMALRFNSDTGNNYAVRSSINGAADGTATSAAYAGLAATASTPAKFSEVDIINIATQEKLITAQTTEVGTAGAANAPNKAEIANKWVNTTDQISSVTVFNSSGTGDFDSGSELVVLGHD